jgi:ATP-dependent DNA ligase
MKAAFIEPMLLLRADKLPESPERLVELKVVALDAEGRPSFNTLQNHGSSGVPLHFFIFDL